MVLLIPPFSGRWATGITAKGGCVPSATFEQNVSKVVFPMSGYL